MTQVSIGDLAQSFVLRRQNTMLKEEMGKLSLELSSGRTSDVASHLSGDYSHLADIERGLRVLQGFDTAATEAQHFTGAMQLALGHVQDTTSDLAASLISTSSGYIETAINSAARSAEADMQAIVATLNTNVAGRSLFSGVATDRSALVSADDIMADLRVAISGAVTSSDVIAAVTDWFEAPGGGFETLGYNGSTTGMSPFPMGDGQSVDLDLRADNEEIRNALKYTAIAALSAEASLSFSMDAKKQLQVYAGEGLLTTQDGLTGIRADLGYAEERIDDNVARIASEKTSLEYARGELLGVDPYETATRLEDVQFQLESLYTITVRLSRLSLVEYMS